MTSIKPRESLLRVDSRTERPVRWRLGIGCSALHLSWTWVAVLVVWACGAEWAVASGVSMSSGTGAGGAAITPIPDNFRCGDESFKVAFEYGMAYVTLADGTMVKLPRLIKPGGEDPEEPRLYTDGRLSFVQEIEGGRAVRFARGRMARITCERVAG